MTKASNISSGMVICLREEFGHSSIPVYYLLVTSGVFYSATFVVANWSRPWGMTLDNITFVQYNPNAYYAITILSYNIIRRRRIERLVIKRKKTEVKKLKQYS